MKLVLSAGSLFTLPLHKIFEIGRDVGFDGIEVIINYDFQYGDNLALMRELQDIMPILSIHAPFLALDRWGDKCNQLVKSVKLAEEAGVPLVNFHPPAWLVFEWKFHRWLKSIDDFQRDIGHDKVIVTIENMPTMGKMKINPYLYGKTSSMINFMEEKNLHLTFDTAHMGTSKANFLDDFHVFYDTGRMKNIHFSDYGNGQEHLIPGHGILPLTRFLNHLRATNYNEALTLELSPYEFSEDEESIREEMAEVYAYLCQETRHDIGEIVGG